MRVIAFNLGTDGSSFYSTKVGDFLIYPRRGSDFWIVYPCYEEGEPVSPVTLHRNRYDAIKRIDRLIR